MADEKKDICGIVMPISKSDEKHSEQHWIEVKTVITKAIEAADCIAQPVWQGSSDPRIQSKILQNLYENPIAVCDLSTLNPNVMLEVGMRLTTKKPTILIAEKGTTLPFDTKDFETEFYDPSLVYSVAENLIEVLSEKIRTTLEASKTGSYHSYVESFTFETVEPQTKSVSQFEYLIEMVEELNQKFERGSTKLANTQRIRAAEDKLAELRKWAALKTTAELGGKQYSEEEINQIIDFAILDDFDDDPVAIARNEDYVVPYDAVDRFVEHAKFGVGKVVEIDGSKVTVNFPRHGKKKLLASFLNWRPND